jgi:four helix bundle protein
MSTIVSFRDLIAWQKAMDLADLVYETTARFPAGERFGLALQMRRAAVSIPSNIAEGSCQSTASYIRHLKIALGSHAELDTQRELATRQKLIAEPLGKALENLVREVGRVTQGLLQSLAQPAQSL